MPSFRSISSVSCGSNSVSHARASGNTTAHFNSRASSTDNAKRIILVYRIYHPNTKSFSLFPGTGFQGVLMVSYDTEVL
eukprot:scaffold6903_cov119-Skeletonema_marinoi.AAC.5